MNNFQKIRSQQLMKLKWRHGYICSLSIVDRTCALSSASGVSASRRTCARRWRMLNYHTFYPWMKWALSPWRELQILWLNSRWMLDVWMLCHQCSVHARPADGSFSHSSGQYFVSIHLVMDSEHLEGCKFQQWMKWQIWLTVFLASTWTFPSDKFGEDQADFIYADLKWSSIKIKHANLWKWLFNN